VRFATSPSSDVKNEWIHTSTPPMPTCHGQGKFHFHIYVYSFHCTAVITATNWPPPWGRVPLEKLTVTWLVKKPLAYYGTEMFVPIFTKSCHLYLPSVRRIHYTLFNSVSWWLISLLSSHLDFDLPKLFMYFKFPYRKFARIIFPPLFATFPPHLILRVLIRFAEGCSRWTLQFYNLQAGPHIPALRSFHI
jgi:hypothetical protein